MIAGLHYIIYLLGEICRRVLPGRFTNRLIRNGGSPRQSEEGDRYLDHPSDKAEKMKSFRAKPKPSMVNVNGFGQSIAVLTSGGDAQGLAFIFLMIISLFMIWAGCS